MATFADYEQALKAGTIHPIARLEFLNEAGFSDFEITDDFIQDGTITCNKQDGVRRTASITLSNLDQEYNINVNKIWIGQQVRILAGIRLPSGEDYLFPQGIFYITNPEETYNPTTKTIRLNLVDKWAGIDGTVGGTLDGIYQINPGDDLFVAAKELLLLDRGNGRPLDPIPPVLDSAYMSKVSYIVDGNGISTEIPFTQAPYTLRTDAESTYADVLLGVNTMLVSTCGYDNTGRLRFTYANSDVKNTDRPIAWEFSVNERELYSATFMHDFNAMCNDVRVIGATVNGVQVTGRATNRNPASDCCVARVGYHTHTETQSKYYTYEQCNELARYYLRRKTIIQKQVTFTSTPLYHLNEDMLVTLLRPEISGIPELYLVTGFTMPLGGTGAMTINAVSVSDIDIFENWDAAYSLTVLCSHGGAIIYETGEQPSFSSTADVTYTLMDANNIEYSTHLSALSAAPTQVSNHTLWFDNSSGYPATSTNMYEYLSGSQFTKLNNTVYVSSTTPSNPSDQDFWFDSSSSSHFLYIYFSEFGGFVPLSLDSYIEDSVEPFCGQDGYMYIDTSQTPCVMKRYTASNATWGSIITHVKIATDGIDTDFSVNDEVTINPTPFGETSDVKIVSDVGEGYITVVACMPFMTHIDSGEITITKSGDRQLPSSITKFEVPQNQVVTFTVSPPVGGITYTISKVTLNGIAIDHNGQTCSFEMPKYDSTINFVLSGINGADLIFTYSGTSSISTLTEGSRSWKVVTLSTSGILEFDADQVANGIILDIHARGAGGGSNSTASGLNGYDVSVNSVYIDYPSITINVLDGGVYNSDRGRFGSESSWGGYTVYAPGGPGAGNNSGNGGQLQNIFGLIENTTYGSGGSIGNAGTKGAVWFRIAN